MPHLVNDIKHSVVCSHTHKSVHCGHAEMSGMHCTGPSQLTNLCPVFYGLHGSDPAGKMTAGTGNSKAGNSTGII